MNEYVPLIVGIIIAVIGSIGGVATFRKVSAEKTNLVAEASEKVVTMVSVQLDEHAKRLDALEEYSEAVNQWADRLLDILEKAIELMPKSYVDEFEEEVDKAKKERPRRRHI